VIFLVWKEKLYEKWALVFDEDRRGGLVPVHKRTNTKFYNLSPFVPLSMKWRGGLGGEVKFV
jgi:hypothetical protein